MVAMTLRKVMDTNTPYVAVNCTWLHLGPHKLYTYSFDEEVPTSVIPAVEDFRFAQQIVGWKCCCSPWGCVRVRGHENAKMTCENTNSWAEVAALNQEFIVKRAKMYSWRD